MSPETSVPSAGSVPPESPPLASSAIERWLADANLDEPIEVRVVPSTGSTNEDLLAEGRRVRAAVVQLLAADEQTAGRGRQRRAWIARPRSALLFSLAVPLPALPAELPAVTLACGVALADHLIAQGAAVRLKWPNDLMLAGRKLGGVLCELAVEPDGLGTLVIGVGVNGWLTDDDRARIGQPAAALSEAVSPSLLAGQREAWIAALTAAVLRAVRRFAAEGFLPWRARFNELLDPRGELVDIIEDGQVLVSGRVVEVDDRGRLMLATPAGLRAISVGDVSLRAAPGSAP
ncbi:MAG TPA: biotin--[acetyl-CoA-carboxylase] ligase [Burkholderiaceae bacterium]|nr:biotin--[acetyl-CoA-carboxylase] ligase [Burkholderiaceae bacterium]